MMSEESRAFGEALLQPFQEHVLPGGGHPAPVVLVKGDERLSDVITAYAESSRADVVVCGSHHLCIKGEVREGSNVWCAVAVRSM